MEGILERIKSGELPPQARAAIAKGVVPLEADQLIPALCYVCGANAELLEDGKRTFSELSDGVKLNFFSDKQVDSKIVDFALRSFPFSIETKQAALLNPQILGETIAVIAPTLEAELLDITVNNQVKIQEHPAIIKGLQANPSLGIIHKQKLEEYGRLLLKPLVSDKAELESKSIADIEKEAISEANEHVRVFGKEKVTRESLIETDKIAQHAHRGEAGEGVEAADTMPGEAERQSITSLVQNMSIPQKVQAAIKGNREMRGILVRDSNKQVCSAVIKSPKITEAEVEFISNLRNVQTEVLRLIAMNREWLKNYKVIHSLVKNPRTPLTYSMKLIHRLNKKDVAMLLRDRNVPEALRTFARRQAMTQRK